jgi:hypothetical protein
MLVPLASTDSAERGLTAQSERDAVRFSSDERIWSNFEVIGPGDISRKRGVLRLRGGTCAPRNFFRKKNPTALRTDPPQSHHWISKLKGA